MLESLETLWKAFPFVPPPNQAALERDFGNSTVLGPSAALGGE